MAYESLATWPLKCHILYTTWIPQWWLWGQAGSSALGLWRDCLNKVDAIKSFAKVVKMLENKFPMISYAH